QSQHSYSETVAAQIDAEIKRLIDEAHAKAVKVLTENRKMLDTMARVLIECETIYAEEVEMIINGATPEEVKKALNERLDRKAAHREAMEKAPVKKLSDFAPVKGTEKPTPVEDTVAEQKAEPTTEQPTSEPEQPTDQNAEAPAEEPTEQAPAKKATRKRTTKKTDDGDNGDNN
ncbi:MAG: hypothetical protein K2I75_04000, partial [Clostridiales bacterium]|nr:hypothetical protein [Clostridiales bacterium]